MNRSDLLTDIDVVNFLVNGYHLLKSNIPAQLNAQIAKRLDTLEYNPGNAIVMLCQNYGK